MTETNCKLSVNWDFLSDYFPWLFLTTTAAFIVGMWVSVWIFHHNHRYVFVQVLQIQKSTVPYLSFQNVCQTLWCSVKGFCRSKLDAAADGTRCGEKKVMCQWCVSDVSGWGRKVAGGGLSVVGKSLGEGAGEQLPLGEWRSSHSESCQREGFHFHSFWAFTGNK